jgi:CheY-like chemotaxis protein
MIAPARILVIEDEPIVAMCLEDMLDTLGHATIGPAGRVAEGLALVEASTPDAAILDINLSGERSDPIAHALVARGVPLVFATGYGAPPEGFGIETPLLEKPYRLEQLRAALAAIGIK